MSAEISRVDAVHLRRCVELASQALENGDAPFGSVLVDSDGHELAAAMNRESSDGDPTAHPEFSLVQWAIAHLTSEQRAASTVYTSGEHCPMCAAAHGWAGLGRVVAAASSAQLAEWRASWGLSAGAVRPLLFSDIAPHVDVIAPVAPFDAEMREVHRRASARAEGERRDDISPARGRRLAPHPPTLGGMADTYFKPGDEVSTPQGRGAVIDVRPTPSGRWIFGVEDDGGVVGYFTSRALRLAEG
ncbi:MAG TPA: nucleoside deaminase [Microbacterium sp.]|nr:nucleoside deaminase [Microbacterium sp.]